MRSRVRRAARSGLEVFADQAIEELIRQPPGRETSAGIAYAAHRIAAARGDANLASWAERTIATAEPTLETHAVRALISRGRGDSEAFETSLKAFLAALDSSPGGVRLLCHLLAAARGFHGEPVPSILEAGGRQVETMWTELADAPAIGDPRGLTDLGAAHGWAGLLHATLLWSEHSGQPLPEGIEERLHQLTSFAAKSSAGIQWPNTARGSFAGRGWCGGGAGHILLWTLAHREWNEPRWLRLAEESARDNVTRLDGPANLCCGLAGQAYAQLALYRHTGELEWLRNAHVLAAAAIDRHRQQKDSRDASLYQGSAGVAVLAAELARPDRAAMPMVEPQPFLRLTGSDRD